MQGLSHLNLTLTPKPQGHTHLLKGPWTCFAVICPKWCPSVLLLNLPFYFIGKLVICCFLLADSKPRHFMFPPLPLLSLNQPYISYRSRLLLYPYVFSLVFFNYFKLHRSPLKQLQHYPVGRLQLFNFLNLLLLTSVTTLITMMLSTYELVFFVAFYIYLFSWL